MAGSRTTCLGALLALSYSITLTVENIDTSNIASCLPGQHMPATAFCRVMNAVAVCNESITVIPLSLRNAWNKSRNDA